MPTLESSLRKNMVEFIQGDLRKLTSTYNYLSKSTNYS